MHYSLVYSKTTKLKGIEIHKNVFMRVYTVHCTAYTQTRTRVRVCIYIKYICLEVILVCVRKNEFICVGGSVWICVACVVFMFVWEYVSANVFYLIKVLKCYTDKVLLYLNLVRILWQWMFASSW